MNAPSRSESSAVAARVAHPTGRAHADTETRLRLAIESTRAGTHARDLLTDEADWSPRLREIYDLADDEPASSTTWLSRVHPEDRARALTAMSAALDPRGDGHYRATFRVVRRDGSIRWVEGHGQVAFDDVGGVRRPVRLAGLTFDVTARVETTNALRDSEARLQLAMRSAALGVFDWDVRRDALRWSEETRRMYGGEPAPRTLEAAFRAIHPDDVEAARDALRRALDPGGDGTFRLLHRVSPRDGPTRWIDACGQVQFDEASRSLREPVRLVGVVADVTDAQQALRALRDADARKDEFLAMLAHELRNPLAPLATAHGVLARSRALGEREHEVLAIAQRQTRQLARLVDDLLEVSRITRGRIELRPEPMGVGSAVFEAAEAVAAAIDARRQRLAVSVPPHPLRIVADPARVQQVLENLLNNASKFTPEGGSIRIEVDEHGDEVEIRVTDTGVGIEPAQLVGIFELFAQADATIDRAQGGLGIGLALVRRLVGLHGGRVWASSRGRGTGATFTVRLPRGEAAGRGPAG